jgi:hypothetical protein
MGARFLGKDERDALGIINRADTGGGLSESPSPSGSLSLGAFGIGRPQGSDAPTAVATDTAAPGTVPPEDATPKAIAVQPDKAELPLMSNGHANGNGHASDSKPIKPLELGGGTKVAFSVSADSPSCADCGSIMVRNGSCYKCLNCGSTSGCS